MHPYAQLAKEAIEAHFFGYSLTKVQRSAAPDLLKLKAGAFVTIYKDGELRGCIGTFVATKDNLADEIISNAISAATADYRFDRITTEELPDLTYEVSILGDPKPIKTIEHLDPKKYGVIVQQGSKRGLLLPDLDQVETVAEQIEIAARKGGIDLNNTNVKFYRFTATKYR